MYPRVLVLNTDMTPMGTTSWQDAVHKICSSRAEIVAETDIRIHPSMLLPAIIRLVKIVRHLWKKKVPWARKNVHTRDQFTCQYCGNKLSQKECTIDHVIPKDQGGKNGWDNTVCSCFDCNNRKGNRTPSQAKMALKKRPWQPTIMEFVQLKLKAEGMDGLMEMLMK